MSAMPHSTGVLVAVVGALLITAAFMQRPAPAAINRLAFKGPSMIAAHIRPQPGSNCNLLEELQNGGCSTSMGLVAPCIIGDFDAHWRAFASSIMVKPDSPNWQPFAFIRFGDGEYLLTQGAALSTQDNWSIESGVSMIGLDLMTMLRVHKGQRLYLGLPAPGQEGSYLPNLLRATHATCQQVTYANLWVNANYPKTKQLWSHLVHNRTQDVVLVVGEPVAAYLRTQLPSKLFAGMMTVPVSGVAQWKGDFRKHSLEEAVHLAQQHAKKIFLVSAGPLAKALISAMWNATQQNQYIDVGSSFDEVGKGVVSRAYMDATTGYSQQKDPCWSIGSIGTPQAVPCIK